MDESLIQTVRISSILAYPILISTGDIDHGMTSLQACWTLPGERTLRLSMT